MTNPLFRFLEREVNVASKQLERIQEDLYQLRSFCNGDIKPTQLIKKLAELLRNNKVPESWKSYKVMDLSINEYITDFKKRLD